MKYIRTKDELGILVESTDCEELQNKKRGVNDMLFKTWYGNDRKRIIAQADTIKELCDEFVVAYEDGARIVYGDLDWAKVKAKASLEFGDKSIIYGAIWTEWGLKYVAKMNEKEGLELL